MIVLSATDITKMYGVEEVFSGIRFSINQGDRIGLVGPNGAGKSTLLNILAGEDSPDRGEVFLDGNLHIGYFHQNDLFTSQRTIREEMLDVFREVIEMEQQLERLSGRIADLSEEGGEALDRALAEYDRLQEVFRLRGGYSYKSDINKVLTSMGFPPETADGSTASLSGGERTRLALAMLLLKQPDILFLDEPTNHLDIETLHWLEQYLRSYPGTVLLISHDRYFLDRTVTRVFELDHHRLQIFEGNYSFYASERRIRRESERKAYEKQSAEIRRQKEMISRYKQRGTEKLAKRARSREKMLDRMQVLDRPVGENDSMKISFRQDTVSGNDTLYAEHLSKTVGSGADSKQVLKDVSFDIKRGERIGIIGPNGAGKSTLLRLILSESLPDSGYLKVGHNIQIGYYDQQQSMLDESSTVIEEMRNAYELYSDTELRNLLGRFLFRGDDVFKPVSVLSGGERARLSLLKLMLSGANLLILDEPTNHLDIVSKEVVEDALVDFPGTSVTVSHDRYLLNRVPTAIYELEDGVITPYPGNYDYYLSKKKQQESETESPASASPTSMSGSSHAAGTGSSAAVGESSSEQRRRVKEQQAEQRRMERRIAALEETIASLEEEIETLEQELTKDEYMTNHVRLAELSADIAAKKESLDEAYSEWAELSEELSAQ